jgi:transcriptional regulator NrdR family protein
MPAKAKPVTGFVCPECKEELRVVDTRKAASGIIIRTRTCPLCYRSVQTVERPHSAITPPIQR